MYVCKCVKCHIYIGIVESSLKYIPLTKSYGNMDSFHIFGIVLKYIRYAMYVCKCVSWRVIQQMCHTLGN